MRRLYWVSAAVVVVVALGLYVALRPASNTPQQGQFAARGPGGPGGGMGGPGGGFRGGRGGGPMMPTVSVTPVVRADMPIYLDALGTVQAFNTVVVRPQVDGKLLKINFQEGQNVRAGDVLAQVDPRLYQAQLDQALAKDAQDRALLANAKLDLERYRTLANEKYGTQQQFDTQKSQVAQLEATLKADAAAIDTARTNLSYTSITAPIDGRTGLRQVDVGNIVSPGDTAGIVTITQLQPISVIFNVPQQRLPDLIQHMGRGGELTTLALNGEGKELDRGKLATLDNQVDPTTGTIKLKAVMPNAQQFLWPGGFVNVRLLLDTLKDALVLPAASVQHGPDGTFVYVVKEDSTVEPRPVTVALTEGDRIAISAGLRPGERVVSSGQDRLQSGARVLVAEEPAAAPDGQPVPPAARQDPSGEQAEGGERRRRRPGGEGAPSQGSGPTGGPAGSPGVGQQGGGGARPAQP